MNFLVKILHYLPIKGSVHVMHILGKLLGVAIVSPVTVLRVFMPRCVNILVRYAEINTRKYMHAETLALLTLYFPNMKYLK